MDFGVSRSSPVFVRLLILGLAFWIVIRVAPFSGPAGLRSTMVLASETMGRATAALRVCRARTGLAIDEETDVNRTGLIGSEFSSITTSVGRLEAKRTAVNPNFAGLVVLLLHQAGVRRGDAVAVGASGSFPALIVAVLCAASAMDVDALVIPSLGASQWGANEPEFHWLDMQRCLVEQGLVRFESVAVSLGGDGDVGDNMAPEGRRMLEDAVRHSGLPLIREPELERNVALRMEYYQQAAGSAPIKAFVNIGGSTPNIGNDALVLRVEPGLARIHSLPPPQRRGVLFAMAARDVPVIHFLFVRGLAAAYGLPWDPRPLPEPGEGAVYGRLRERSPAFLMLGLVYLAAVIGLLIHDRSGRRRRADDPTRRADDPRRGMDDSRRRTGGPGHQDA